MKDRERYDSLFRYYCEGRLITWQRLKAQACSESAFNPTAVSPAGAKGLMQAMDPTWDEWTKGESPYNPEAAISFGARYMSWLIKQFDGSLEQATAAYNWGIGNLKRCLNKYREAWRDHLPAETREYLRRVAKCEEEFTCNV